MASESLLQELQDTQLAVELISLGARMQLLEHTVRLSRGKMTRLYKELTGVSPPKGMLPFSADWFMVWEHNVHSSLFCHIFDYMKKQAPDESAIKTLIPAYRTYLKYAGNTKTLSLTRAWILRRFVDSGMLSFTPCCQCGGKFITHAGEPAHSYRCVMCCPPSRAIKKALQCNLSTVSRTGPESSGENTKRNTLCQGIYSCGVTGNIKPPPHQDEFLFIPPVSDRKTIIPDNNLPGEIKNQTHQ